MHSWLDDAEGVGEGDIGGVSTKTAPSEEVSSFAESSSLFKVRKRDSMT